MIAQAYSLPHFRQGSYASWKTWKIAILFSRPVKLMEFEKNAKTHGKLMEKIFVNKKNVVMPFFLSSPCDVIELETFFNNFMSGICLNFVMEKINSVMENSWKKIHTVE